MNAVATSELERITDDEHAYLLRVIAGYSQIPALQEEIAKRSGAFQAYAEHLHAKYELDVARGEMVNEDGTIIRVRMNGGDN